MELWTGGNSNEPMTSSYDSIFIGGAVLTLGIVTGVQKLINGGFELRSKLSGKANPLMPNSYKSIKQKEKRGNFSKNDF